MKITVSININGDSMLLFLLLILIPLEIPKHLKKNTFRFKKLYEITNQDGNFYRRSSAVELENGHLAVLVKLS